MGRGAKAPGPAGNLRVVTTQMKAGYLRKNGVPYSEKATLEEYFDTFTEPDGNSWLVVSSIVTDTQYLTGPYTWTAHFKKVPDGQGWIRRPVARTKFAETRANRRLRRLPTESGRRRV